MLCFSPSLYASLFWRHIYYCIPVVDVMMTFFSTVNSLLQFTATYNELLSMPVVLFLSLGVMLNIDFAEKLDLVQHLNAYSNRSPGEIGVADGEENVRPVMLSMLFPFIYLFFNFALSCYGGIIHI